LTAALTIRSRLAEIARASDWMADGTGPLELDSSIRLAMRLCLEEALANVVTHATSGTDGQAITVTLSIDQDAVHLGIEDSGPAFDPTVAVAPAVNDGIEVATIGGRGLTLIRGFSDRLDYCRQEGRNRFVMTFNRDRSAPDR